MNRRIASAFSPPLPAAMPWAKHAFAAGRGRPGGDLFSPVQLGAIEVANGIVIAVVTRLRAGEDGVPEDLHVQYYLQRASAGLIITERASISPLQRGEPGTAGIWSRAQVDGWKRVTDAVHAAAGKIALLLGHVDPTSEIVGRYVHAAGNAKRAGFDGVEIDMGGNFFRGQVLTGSIIKSNDAYAGNVENRVRMALETIDAVASVWGGGRVGIRLSPAPPDSDAMATFGHLIDRLRTFNLAYLHFVQDSIESDRSTTPDFDLDALRARAGGAHITSFPSGWCTFQ